jgi:hypothetical protein
VTQRAALDARLEPHQFSTLEGGSAGNQASHPGVVIDDAAAVEELLVLTARQVPIFWELPIAAAVAKGFVVG